MGYLERVAPAPERRGGRDRLTVRDPLIENALQAANFDIANISETRRFGNRMAAEVRRFLVGRNGSNRGRISKADAVRMLSAALARLERQVAE